MAKEFDFYFDIGSPATYLAWTQVPRLAEETGAKANYKPILLGGVFKATGNSSPITVPEKGRWLFKDLTRWANRYGIEFNLNSKFPINTLYMMRGMIAYLEDDRFLALGDAFFEAMWVKDKDLNQPEVMAEVVSSAGVDPAEFMERINDQKTKDALMEATQAVIDRAAFGAPTFFVGDEMFWGQDRMEFVRDALLN
ncbi:MAG: 2-hydroxychromene-2-carboxylate isomerase [Pseudomonadota bacterium]